MKDLQGNEIKVDCLPWAANQKRHAIRRASERYGFELTEADYDSIRDRILLLFSRVDPGVVLLDRQTKHRALWAVWHGAEWLPVIYDKRQKTIVTFLPKKVLKGHKEKLPF